MVEAIHAVHDEAASSVDVAMGGMLSVVCAAFSRALQCSTMLSVCTPRSRCSVSSNRSKSSTPEPGEVEGTLHVDVPTAAEGNL
eukprot:3328905-Alexandrium_andersonii.AAC.1